jgi:hypothetical protein
MHLPQRRPTRPPRPGRSISRRPPPRRRSRLRASYVIIGLAVIAAAGFIAWLGLGGRGAEGRTAPAAEPAPIRLVLSGVGQGSLVEVRRRSAAGSLVFRGRVAGGELRRFKAARPLWVRLRPAANVRVTLSGRRVPPANARGPFLATRRGLVPAA